MASHHQSFSLYLFEEDIRRIKSWVLQYPYLETGGTLFGLWNNDRDPVAHIVLGPGEGCKRTGYSFYQDIPYLERVGNMLTRDYMLCHIGEWHSHHRLGLYKPSSGDVNTVVRNYPRGVSGFLLMIANITSATEVKLSPYMFTGSSNYRHGNVVPICGKSPFRNISRISGNIRNGQEVSAQSWGRVSSPLVATGFKKRGKQTRTMAVATTPFPTQQDDVPSRRRGTGHAANRLLPRPPARPLLNLDYTADRGLTGSPSAVEASKCTRRDQWYSQERGQTLLRKIHDSLVRFPSTSNIEMTRESATQDLSMSFIHHGREWRVDFPSRFPEQDPTLTSDTGGRHTKSVRMHASEKGNFKTVVDNVRLHCNQCNLSGRYRRYGSRYVHCC